MLRRDLSVKRIDQVFVFLHCAVWRLATTWKYRASMTNKQYSELYTNLLWELRRQKRLTMDPTSGPISWRLELIDFWCIPYTQDEV